MRGDDALTVVVFLWCGWRPLYQAEHVNALQRMLREYLRQPHRMLCFTNEPKGIECETQPLWSWPDVPTAPKAPNCYRRLKLFDPAMRETLGPRILAMDLDAVIFDDITPLITHHDFRIVKGYTALYNGSMWLHTTGTRPQVYTDFNPKTSPHTVRGPAAKAYKGSDQAWISAKLPREATWSRDDGVHMYHEFTILGRPMPDRPRIVFFPGPTKPWQDKVKKAFPDIHRQYMRFYVPMNGSG